MNIVPFRPEAAANEPSEQPHYRGKAKCVACSHEWQAVAAVGTRGSVLPDTASGLQCPSCSAMRGVLLQHVLWEKVPVWLCTECEAFLFTFGLIKGVQCIQCVGCGEIRNAIDLFNK